MSSTQEWKVSDLQMEPPSHRLLWCISQRLEQNGGVIPWIPGEIIGAALDGDGDRCLLIEGTSDGLKVIDGDRMCDDIIRASLVNKFEQWKMASSIELDLYQNGIGNAGLRVLVSACAHEGAYAQLTGFEPNGKSSFDDNGRG